MPTEADILAIAQQIPKAAAWRRGVRELNWFPREHVQSGQTPYVSRYDADAGVYRGSEADYQLLESSYQWIVDAIRVAIPPDPAGFAGPNQSMLDAISALRGGTPPPIARPEAGPDGKVRITVGNDPIGSTGALHVHLRSSLERWSGPASDSFRKHYADLIPDIVTNQIDVAMSLAATAKACSLVYDAARVRLKVIADTALKVLKLQDDTVSPDLSIAMSATAGAFAIGAAVPGIGTAAVAVLTTISAAVGFGKDVYQDQREAAEQQRQECDAKRSPAEREIDGLHIGGATVEAVLDRTYEAVCTIQRKVSDAENTIIDTIEENIDIMRRWKSSFTLPASKLVERTRTPDDLKELRNDQKTPLLADGDPGNR